MDAPSMVQRSGDKFIVRSVVSGDQYFVDHNKAKDKSATTADSDEDTVNDLVINEDALAEQEIDEEEEEPEEDVENNAHQQPQEEEWRQQLVKHNLIQLMNQNLETENLRWLLFNNNNSVMQNNNLGPSVPQHTNDDMPKDMGESNLPQCKIKRNYSCSSCTYFTQNPRQYLMHLRDTHGEKLIIHECKHCIYASRHYQKLVRHMKMVHGLSVDQDGSHLAIRKRGGPSIQQQQQLQSQLLSHFASSVKRAKSSSAGSSMGADEINNNSVVVLGSGGAGGSDQPGEAKGGPRCSSTSRNNDKSNNCNATASGRNDTWITGDGVGGGHAVFNKRSSSFVLNQDNNDRSGDDGVDNEFGYRKTFFGDQNDNSSDGDEGGEEVAQQYHCQISKNGSTPYPVAIINNNLISSELTCKPTENLMCANIIKEGLDDANQSSGVNSINHLAQAIGRTALPKHQSLYDLLNASSTSHNPTVNNYLITTGTTPAAEDQQLNSKDAAADALMMMLLFQQQPQSSINTVLNNPSPDFSHSATRINNATINNTTDNNHRLLKCTVCDFETLNRELMSEHEAKDHKKTKFFRCAKCNYVTHIKTRFSKHVKYHSMPMIKCNMCDFRTPYKWNLDRHMKNHGGSGPFKCAACNFTADIKQSLTVHEMNHHDPPVGNAAGSALNHLQSVQDQQRRRNRVGGSDITGAGGGNELIAQQMAEDGTNDLATGLSFHFLEGASMLSDHLKSVDLIQKKSARPIPNLIPIQAPPISGPASTSALNLSNKSNDSRSRHTDSNSETSANDVNLDQDENSNPASMNSAFKKKHGSFFDKLKEKIGTNEDGGNLTCNCGHVAKCLSELFIHQKACQKFKQHQISIKTFTPNLINNKNSSRCQYCRHRCKSSADLVAHMQNCSNAQLFLSNALNVNIEQDSMSEMGNSDKLDDEDRDSAPMENRIFVWNRMPETNEPNEGSLTGSMSGNEGNNPDISAFTSTPIKQEKMDDMDIPPYPQSPNTGKMDSQQHGIRLKTSGDQNTSTCLKKVFKCPHCSFWASTASRFHVHIVGHLNKKPFECSLCAYRSNWRWDITKHIRLKTIRDPGHKTAKVLMNDETGRRNYTKYNKYITLMKVTDGDGNLKLMKSGEMTPNQEATLQSPHSSKVSMSPSGLPASSSSGSMQKANLSAMQKILLSDTTSANLLKLSQAAALNSDELLSRNDLSALFSDQTMEKKQTSFKCKKCHFKHPNRLVVLDHVKGHYRDAGPSTSDPTLAHSSPMDITPIYNTTNNNLVGALSAADTNLLLANSKTLSNLLASQTLLPIMSAVNGGQLNPAGKTNLNAIVMSSGSVNGNGDIVGGGVVGGGGLVANQITSLKTSALTQAQSLSGLTMGAGSGGALNTPAQKVSMNILPKPLASREALHSRTKPVINTHSTQINDHGEMADEASSGGTVGHNYRSQLSYRCGHCQQVSNWKHVIQRHCRLKHNGNINIEQIGKNRTAAPKNAYENSNRNVMGSSEAMDKSKTNQSVNLQQLNSSSSPNTITISPVGVTNHNRISNPIGQQLPLLAPLLRGSTAALPMTSQGIKHRTMTSTNHQSKEMQEVQNRFSSLINTISGVGGEATDNNSISLKKQYECTRCSYVTDNKSQFSYHRSLHKPLQGDELKCNYCDYRATKRHLLSQHMRIHQSGSEDVIVVEQENHSVFLGNKNISAGSTTNDKNSPETDEKNSSGESARPSENKENHIGSSTKKKKWEFMCPHCPYSDSNSDLVNDHKQFHFAVSNERLTFVCEFCDFNAHSDKTMREHRKLHFTFLEKGTSAIEFCTTYDNLKLFVATKRSSGSSKDKKIYDEEEIEDENPWIHSAPGITSSSAQSSMSKNGNPTKAMNNIGSEIGTGTAIINV